MILLFPGYQFLEMKNVCDIETNNEPDIEIIKLNIAA